jgi:hypothetical protein
VPGVVAEHGGRGDVGRGRVDGDATALLLEMRVAEGDPVRCSTGAWVRPGPPAAVPRPRRLPRSGPGVRQHRPHDVGLIHLAGDGVFPEVPATPIYAHDEGLDIQEWRGSRRFVHHTGYGLGTPPTVPATCGERGTTSGTKRLGVSRPDGRPSPVLGGTPLAVYSDPAIGELCRGDSSSSCSASPSPGACSSSARRCSTNRRRTTSSAPGKKPRTRRRRTSAGERLPWPAVLSSAWRSRTP